jgi:hypothetical protein
MVLGSATFSRRQMTGKPSSPVLSVPLTARGTTCSARCDSDVTGSRPDMVTPSSLSRHGRVKVLDPPRMSTLPGAARARRSSSRRDSKIRHNDFVSQNGFDDQSLSDADRVSLWLMSADGKRAVKRTLQNLRLPATFDADLIVQVCHSADRMMAKGEPIKSIPAFATRVLNQRGKDLVRSPRSSVGSLLVHGDDGAVQLDPPQTDTNPIEDLHVDLDAIAIRHTLGAAWHTEEPWKVSAALTVLTVLFDEAGPGDRCPRPVGGASPVEAAHWVGLWYAGRRELFPGPGRPAGNTLTKQRSRASQQVRELLKASASAIGGGE